ncbi:MAG: histidine kinase [Cyclobacteriaceae bacterium]
MKNLILSLLFLVTQLTAFTQTSTVDSLNVILEKATGRERIDVLNNLLEEYICSHDSLAVVTYNKVRVALKTEDYPKGRLLSLKHYGSMKYCSNDLDSTIYYYRTAANTGLANSLEETGQLLSRLGFYFQTAGNFDSSYYYLMKGLNHGVDTGDSLTIGSTNIGLGTIYQQRGQLDSALGSYFRALEISEQMDHKPMLITAKLNIATFYYDHQPDRLRISDFEELLQTTREIGDQLREISVLEWLGYLEADSGEYDLAVKYFNDGLRVNKQVQDQNSEILLLQGVSYAHNLSGDHEQSVETNNKIIDLARSSGYELYLPAMYANNVTNYIALGNYDKAIENGLAAIYAGNKSGQKELYFKILPEMAIAYNKLGQSMKAYETQLEFTKLNKEIFDEEKSKQFAEMEAKYETAKKEAEIESLSQQAAIQTLEIQQKNQGIIIGVVLMLLIIISIFFIYERRSFKRKRNQTELEQRFLRSQLNPHFISNALVAVQNFMLKNNAEAAAQYLTKFSKLMREILENSRREFIPVEEEINMLTNYLDIHKLRLNDGFDYTIKLGENIDPETDTIPPMFIQPFLENSIEHGINPLEKKGEITLSFEKQGEYISINVTDNGKGLGSKEKSTDHTSLSTTIIKERMEQFNKTLKSKIQLVLSEISNDNGEIEGTKVELKVPFSYI